MKKHQIEDQFARVFNYGSNGNRQVLINIQGRNEQEVLRVMMQNHLKYIRADKSIKAAIRTRRAALLLSLADACGMRLEVEKGIDLKVGAQEAG